jgi:hypothetical protein
MEGFVQVLASFQATNGGRKFAKNALDTSTPKSYVHRSRFTGLVRVYGTAEEFATDCTFKDAAAYVTGLHDSIHGIALAEDTLSGIWYLLWDANDLIGRHEEKDFGSKRLKMGE